MGFCTIHDKWFNFTCWDCEQEMSEAMGVNKVRGGAHQTPYKPGERQAMPRPARLTQEQARQQDAAVAMFDDAVKACVESNVHVTAVALIMTKHLSTDVLEEMSNLLGRAAHMLGREK